MAVCSVMLTWNYHRSNWAYTACSSVRCSRTDRPCRSTHCSCRTSFGGYRSSSNGRSTYLLYRCSCTVQISRSTHCLFNACTTSVSLRKTSIVDASTRCSSDLRSKCRSSFLIVSLVLCTSRLVLWCLEELSIASPTVDPPMHSLQVCTDALFNGLLLNNVDEIQTIQLLAFDTVTPVAVYLF